MMKILLLNPHVDTEHQIVRALQARDIGVLLPLDIEEAWQMLQLHGTSVSLAIIHRESGRAGDEGIRLIQKLKSSAEQADLPIILSSKEWGDPDFAAHQSSPEGVHAYLSWPFTGEQAIQLMDQIFSPQPQQEEVSAVTQDMGELTLDSSFIEKPQTVPEDSGTQALSLDEGASSLLFSQSSHSISSEEAVPQDSEAVELKPLGDADDLDAPIANAEDQAPANGTMVLSLGTESPDSNDSIDSSPASESPRESPSEQVFSTESETPAKGEPEEEKKEPQAGAGPEEDADESELAVDLPYLFSAKPKKPEAELIFAQPVGDAVIPGGAAQSPDTETLKKYLMLREQDVAVLSSKLKTADERIFTLESTLRAERGKCSDLERILEERRTRIEGFEKEKELAIESFQVEISDLRFQNKAKNDKARLLEQQVKEATDEIERLKDRVRADIRKIRVREKELENKLELMKKDSEALLSGRENKIIELKRKVDLLEFNMDLLQDQYSREKEASARLRELLAKAAQVVRVASGILDSNSANDSNGGTASSVAAGPVKPEGEPKAS